MPTTDGPAAGHAGAGATRAVTYPDDGARLATALSDRLATLAFVDLTTEQVTGLLADTIADWGAACGWRVYRRAASVVPLPPPMSGQRSVVDVACARPAAPPVVIEVDHTDRRRTVEKLLAEADAGRVPIWVRWGSRGFAAPPEPVRMVTLTVTARRGEAGVRLHSRRPARQLPPPTHHAEPVTAGPPDSLFDPTAGS
ncbi:hypothetical protein MCAG_03089 [Micromonospora sp. ATCC 39149]|uniref:hypothetical protein n=1 Tax=Micromonospora sp. (strain ATCC 39149 / NRRL 15099 / SCC 1413) TaxID=219305 RepID=UPI0001A50135|nr:hypothetical protein [Micromonospora sp. ATCC 39149]EEP72762.1 hypothetical protein MCAG_03089 [Micromonospora sp. ATCC 39149]